MTLLPVLLFSVALAADAPAPPSFPFAEDFAAGAAQRWQTFAGDWAFDAGAVHQKSGDYDCGAAVKVKPTGAYAVTVRFKPDGAFNGGGLFFALPGTDKKHGGMMVRCDPGGRVLWGWFDNGGTFNYYADAMYDDDGDTAQELTIAVDPAKSAFNVYHHRERIATNVRTLHTDGFVGMQTSGGPHTFTHFEVRPAKPEELAGLTAPGRLSGMLDILGDADALVILRLAPEFLIRLDADGKEIGTARVADVHGLSGGELDPVGLAWQSPAKGANLLVLAERGSAIFAFNRDLKQVGDKPIVRSAAMHGAGLATDADGRIFVADEALPGVRVFAPDGKELLAFGQKGDVATFARPTPEKADKFKAPRGVAVGPKGEIVVTDRENYTYRVFKFDAAGPKLEWLDTGPWLPYPGGVRFDPQGRLLLASTFEFYRSYGALRRMTLDGLGQAVFVGPTLGDLCDKVRASAGPGDKYYLADPDKDRVLVLPANFIEPLPRFEWTADGVKVTITKTDGATTTATGNARTADGQRVVVQPTEPVCTVWPELDPKTLRAYELPPAPPKGQMYVIDMPVLVAVFTQAVDEKGKHVKLAAAPDELIARMTRELEPERLFYWLSSRATLNKQYEFMVIDDVEAKVDGGWIQPSEARRLVNEARVKRGLPKIDDNHSLVGIHPLGEFDTDTTDDVGFVGGGGLTPYAYSGYALWNHGQGWLMAHEWGHQLDAYFEKSGFTDWWLNHPDATVHIGRYGEHWDCNAFLCRRADKLNWLRFKFGTLRLVTDADEDGVPDEDDTLPVDELRFGSDPTKRDTDGDGLDDLAELTASTFTSADPVAADSDGDGIPDAKDPYPTFAVATSIAPAAASAGSAAGAPLPAGAGTPLGRIENAWCQAEVAAAYDADHLYFVVTLERPAQQVYLPIDWNNDGWFTGRDNVYYSVDLDWPEGGPAKLKAAHGCEARVDNVEDTAVVSVAVARPDYRAPLRAGSHVGLIPRVQNGGGTVAFLLDPWQILGVELR